MAARKFGCSQIAILQAIYLRFHIPRCESSCWSVECVDKLLVQYHKPHPSQRGAKYGLWDYCWPWSEMWLVRQLCWHINFKLQIRLWEKRAAGVVHTWPQEQGGPQTMLNSFRYNLVNLTSQFSFSIVSRYSDDFKSACFFASSKLLMQISKSMLVSYVPTALGPCMSWGSFTFCYVTM